MHKPPERRQGVAVQCQNFQLWQDWKVPQVLEAVHPEVQLSGFLIGLHKGVKRVTLGLFFGGVLPFSPSMGAR